MNDTDRKFLTEWGGEKWHTEAEYPDPVCADYTGKPYDPPADEGQEP